MAWINFFEGVWNGDDRLQHEILQDLRGIIQ